MRERNVMRRRMWGNKFVICDIENPPLLQSVLEQGMKTVRSQREEMVEKRIIDVHGHLLIKDLPPDMRGDSPTEV